MSSVGDKIRMDLLLNALKGKDVSNCTIIFGNCCFEVKQKIIADLRKLDKIEQIIKDYDGTTPSMIKQFSEIQKVLEKE